MEQMKKLKEEIGATDLKSQLFMTQVSGQPGHLLRP